MAEARNRRSPSSGRTRIFPVRPLIDQALKHEEVVNVNRNAGIISSEVTATRAPSVAVFAAGSLFLLSFVIQIVVRPEFRPRESRSFSYS